MSDPANASEPKADHPICDAQLEHADRCWEAECENAERITKERQLLVTAIIAFVGLGVFKSDWLGHVIAAAAHVDWRLAWVQCGLIILTLLLFVGAVMRMARRPSVGAASVRLQLSRAVRAVGSTDEEETRREVFLRTYRGYQDLQERNEKGRQRLGSATTLFVMGLVAAILLVGIFVVCETMRLDKPAAGLSGSDAK